MSEQMWWSAMVREPVREDDPILTEAAGWCKCHDCGDDIEPGDPCIDMRDGTGDVLCCMCGDERGLL